MNAGRAPASRNSRLTKVYSVNWPRKVRALEDTTAASAPRPPGLSADRAGASLLTLGSSLATSNRVITDSAASTPNAVRHPSAVPSEVERGTPRTKPAVAPPAAMASARPTCAPRISRGTYPMQSEKNRACVIPPIVRPTASTANDRGHGDQRVAERVAQQRGQQQRLAREPCGGQGQRNGQCGDHDGVQGDQQSGDRVRDAKRLADGRKQPDGQHLGGDGQARGQGERQQASQVLPQAVSGQLDGGARRH